MALLAFCAGVKPADAVSNLSEWLSLAGIRQVPSWLATKSADKYAFWTGIIGFIVSCVFLVMGRIKSTKTVNDKHDVISMKDAATRYYSQARDCGSEVAKDIEVLQNQGTDAMLARAALILSLKIPMCGKRPPSTILEPISNDAIRSSQLHFKGAGNDLHKVLGGAVAFNEIQVKIKDLEQIITEMRSRKL